MMGGNLFLHHKADCACFYCKRQRGEHIISHQWAYDKVMRSLTTDLTGRIREVARRERMSIEAVICTVLKQSEWLWM